ncbi:MAG: outer membrane protein transport protein [Deltaproteobacteria bacterium]|nr:outer membrane protein transport protein [Deltaproteobacteria bacterium]
MHRMPTGIRFSVYPFITVALVAVCVLPATSANAGGIAVGEQGAVAAGRSGAFVAKADDASAMEYNPAGLTALKGWQLYLGNRFGYDNQQFRRAPLWEYPDELSGPRYRTFKTVSNEKPFILLGPMLALTTDFGLENWTFAIGAYAPAGVAQKQFPRDVGEIIDGEDIDAGQRFMLTRMDTKILYYNLSAAWKINEKFGVGVSLQWVDLAQLDLRLIVNGDDSPGLVTPVSHNFDMEARIQGSDHVGFSGVAGMWFRPIPAFQLGLSSRFVPTRLNASAKLSLSPAHEDMADEPVDIGRFNADSSDDLTGALDGSRDVAFSMTMPMELRGGARYIHFRNARELFDLELDVRLEFWSQNEAYRINGDGLYARFAGHTVEVGKITIPKNWKNTFSVRLGGDVNVVENRLKLRAGTFFETAAVDKAYAYVDFMASSRIGASAGASLTLGRFDIGVSYAYIIEIPFTVSETEGKIYQQMPGSQCEGPDYDDATLCNEHYMGQPSATANSGTYIGTYHFASLALAYRF